MYEVPSVSSRKISMDGSQLCCTYFVDSVQGGRQYMEDFICSTETETSRLSGKSVINHKLLTNHKTVVFGMFDGHGGPEAAKFAQSNLLHEIINHQGFSSSDEHHIVRALEEGFVSTSQKMWGVIDQWPQTASKRPSTAGTTASLVLIKDGKMYIAHVGDSTVVLGVLNQPSTASDTSRLCAAKVLTKDHKPSLPAEKARIEESGGSVAEKAGVHRVVWRRHKLNQHGHVLRTTPFDNIPFLAVSRALGDLWSYNAQTEQYVVSPRPDVTAFEIDVKLHKFLIIATDGLWNVVTPSEATAVVECFIEKIKKKESSTSKLSPASILIKLALRRWSRHSVAADNISVIVIAFEDGQGHHSSTSSSPVCENSIRDCGIGCDSDGMAIRHYVEGSRRLFACNTESSSLKRAHLPPDPLCKKRKVSGKFQIPTTSDQWKTFWNSRRGSVGEVMANSVLRKLESNDLAEKDSNLMTPGES